MKYFLPLVILLLCFSFPLFATEELPSQRSVTLAVS